MNSDIEVDRSYACPGVSTHARQRMFERMGRDLTRQEWADAVLDIVDRRAILVRVSTDRNELYAVAIGGVVAQMWWLPDEALIVTVLAHDMSSAGKIGEMAARAKIRHARTSPAHYHNGRLREAKKFYAKTT